jgi:hypothetical protein
MNSWMEDEGMKRLKFAFTEDGKGRGSFDSAGKMASMSAIALPPENGFSLVQKPMGLKRCESRML